MSQRSSRRSADQVEFLTAFGRRVRHLRNARGMTQEALAHAVQMDRSFVAEVETGSRNPSMISVARIARGLDVSLEELFEGVRVPPPA